MSREKTHLHTKIGSPCKTVRVNNFNKLHTMVLAAHVEKLEVYKMEQGGIFKPALLCRDYPKIACHHKIKELANTTKDLEIFLRENIERASFIIVAYLMFASQDAKNISGVHSEYTDHILIINYSRIWEHLVGHRGRGIVVNL